jgi:hypothetical protein
MKNQNLFKEAIADAKQIREAALANAKTALTEALTPRLQSMISAKLNEMDEDEEEMEEGFNTTQGGWDEENDSTTLKEESEDELEEEFNLDEILAEMDEDESESEEEELEESKKKEKEDEKESEEVKDMTVSELKELIKDIISQELEHEEKETPEDEASEDEHMSDHNEEDEDINLDEILAEMDSMHDEDEEEYEEEMEEAKKKKAKKTSTTYADYIDGKGHNDSKHPGEKNHGKVDKEMNYNKVKGFNSKEDKMMKEAIKTINTLRSELHEVNLLNAKLIYVNKIFKAKNLNESQKVKVITSFDKATNVKEAKMIYESLSNTLTTKQPKQSIKESMGFASKASGVSRKNSIVETNDVISRMQTLANIKK